MQKVFFQGHRISFVTELTNIFTKVINEVGRIFIIPITELLLAIVSNETIDFY